jgi:hypothetical protein
VTIPLPDAAVVHRVGGAAGNLRLSAADLTCNPPGLSVLVGGTPQDAAADMRRVFRHSRKWRATAGTVGSASVAAIRAAGFEVIPDPTPRFSNHARIVHPDGEAGFTAANVARLALAFTDVTGC